MEDKKKNKVEDNKEVSKTEGVEKNPNLLTDKVKNMSEMSLSNAMLNNIKTSIDKTADKELQNQYKEFVASTLKNTIANDFPDYYDQFSNLNYDEIMARVKNLNKIGNNDGLNLFVTDGDGKLTSTTFYISPNSYYSSMMNVINRVTIGINRISLGDSFDAYDMFYAGYLESGEAMLRTMGYSITGVNQLDQSVLLPSSTQAVSGYQCSLRPLH